VRISLRAVWNYLSAPAHRRQWRTNAGTSYGKSPGRSPEVIYPRHEAGKVLSGSSTGDYTEYWLELTGVRPRPSILIRMPRGPLGH
jgi:hypothetical protein